MSDKIWNAIISLSMLAMVAVLGLSLIKPLNKIERAIVFLPLLALGAHCLFKPINAMKRSEGRWSFGLKLDLDANPPSKKAIILTRIFGVLLILFMLNTLVNLFRN